jgi:hypothetical protein
MTSPLTYEFGTVSDIFHNIYEESKAANLFISSYESGQKKQGTYPLLLFCLLNRVRNTLYENINQK